MTPSALVDWSLVVAHLGRMIFAFVLAFPLGWERGRGRHASGFRTFPVVAMASCGYALIARNLDGADAHSLTRLMQGLMAGIGFIGGGVILKQNGDVRGLVTAASIWNTGAIGVSVAYDRVEIAIVLAVVNFLAVIALTPLNQGPARTKTPPARKPRAASQGSARWSFSLAPRRGLDGRGVLRRPLRNPGS